jgi:hypothetical protein
MPVVGEALWGPDGNVLKIAGRVLHGEVKDYKVSNLDWEGIKAHLNFGDWIKQTLYAGKGLIDTTYTRLYLPLNSKKACDKHVNSRKYKLGPLSKPLKAMIAAGIAKKGVSNAKKDAGDEKKDAGALKKKANVKKDADAAKKAISTAAIKVLSKRTSVSDSKRDSKRYKANFSAMQGFSRSDVATSEGEEYGALKDDITPHLATGGK